MSTTIDTMTHDDAASAQINGKNRASSRKRRRLTLFNFIMALLLLQAVSLVVTFKRSTSVNDLNLMPPRDFSASFSNGRPRDFSMGDIKSENDTESTTEARKYEDEGAVDQAMWELEESQENAIDNYYSRKHITSELTGNKVPLVVGGSDGSGTRAFVDILGRLGVPMLVDDAGTMDVHGKQLMSGKGWPPLVSAVLKETRSSNYNFFNMSENIRHVSVTELSKLRDNFNGRGNNIIRKARAKNLTSFSKDISYGFKAPVSMLLVPILQQVLGPMKYLHIVRDGRDVAMSSNQSPVKKFYSDTYADGPARLKSYTGDLEHVLGMQLWNDWNTGLLEYEQEHADGVTFDFLVMRTEDLLNPGSRFKSLVQLSHFVGSPRTLDELCCMARQDAIRDMGESVKIRDINDPFSRFRVRRHFRNNLVASEKMKAAVAKMRGHARSMTASAGVSQVPPQASRKLRQVEFNMTKTDLEAHTRELMPQEKMNPLTDFSSLQLVERSQTRIGVESTYPVATAAGKPFKFFDAKFRFKSEKFVTMESGFEDGSGTRRLSEKLLLEKVPSYLDGKKLAVEDRYHEQMNRLTTMLLKAQEHGENEKVETLKKTIHYLTAKVKQMKARESSDNEERIPPQETVGNVSRPTAGGNIDWVVPVEKLGRTTERPGLSNLTRDLILATRPMEVTKRYGKWVELLKDKKELSKQLHEQGAKGLEAFGYKPARRFQDPGDNMNFKCDSSVQCQ